MEESLLRVRDLVVEYETAGGSIRAVDKVSLELRKGETLGIVGESGSGKSTLGMSLLGLVQSPGHITRGSIEFEGRDLLSLTSQEWRGIRGKTISMIFQDPMTSLNPLMTVGKHIVELIQTHRPEAGEGDAIKEAMLLLEKLGISTDRVNDYPHQFSGGMRQRIMIGLALALNPTLVIADEPTTALDVIVEAQILELLKGLKTEFNLTLALITHNMGVVAEVADRIAVMYAGKIVEIAETAALYDRALHPYTQGLLRSVPNVLAKGRVLEAIPGSPPDLVSPPSGCRFHPRCPFAFGRCVSESPELLQVEPGHWVACHLYSTTQN